MDPLLTVDDALVAGTVVDRPNRFVVRVRFDDKPERAFLGDPGALDGVLEPGREILCTPVDDPDRATAYDAIAVRVGNSHVSVRAALANDLFRAALERGAVPAFAGHSLEAREPELPDHGRSDFRLATPQGAEAYVEVKSCTHADGRVAKFPDRQTERGRRHLRSLEALVEGGRAAHLVFVVQRADVDCLRPYRAVDPAFAELLARVRDRGVGVHAIATSFDPPDYLLRDADLPVYVTSDEKSA